MEANNKIRFRPISFFSLWIISSTAYMIAIGALMDIVPPRIGWISKIAFPITIAAGLLAAIVSAKRNKEEATTLQTIIQDSAISVVGAAILIILYTISIIVTPNVYLTKSEIILMLSESGLNPVQVQQIDKMLAEQGFVTLEDINKIGLNEQQIRDMEELLGKQGFVRESDVIQIVKTQNALVATQTAVAKFTTCFIEPEENYNTVTVRKSPSDKSSHVGYLVQDEKVHVIGHNGGRVNQDKWWLVEIKHGDGEVVYGWVASWVVAEINEIECVKVTQSPGN